MKTTLQAKVDARNRANSEAVKYWKLAVEALQPFEGQIILKKDNTLMKKVQDALPKVEVENGRGYYSAEFGYNLKVCIDCHEVDGNGHAFYQDAVFYIAEIHYGFLSKFYDEPTFQTIEAKQIEQARKDYKFHREKMNDAAAVFNGFGEYDR